jgi:hypothetical protein
MVLIREWGLEFAAYFNCSRNIIPFEEENRTTTVSAVLDSFKSSERGRSNREALINTAH